VRRVYHRYSVRTRWRLDCGVSYPALCPAQVPLLGWEVAWGAGAARSRGGRAGCPWVGTGRTMPRGAPGRPGDGVRAVCPWHGRSGSSRADQPDGHRAARTARRWPDPGWSRFHHRRARSPRRPSRHRAAFPAATHSWSGARSGLCRCPLCNDCQLADNELASARRTSRLSLRCSTPIASVRFRQHEHHRQAVITTNSRGCTTASCTEAWPWSVAAVVA